MHVVNCVSAVAEDLAQYVQHCRLGQGKYVVFRTELIYLSDAPGSPLPQASCASEPWPRD